jgi:hypothetical protein
MDAVQNRGRASSAGGDESGAAAMTMTQLLMEVDPLDIWTIRGDCTSRMLYRYDREQGAVTAADSGHVIRVFVLAACCGL